MKHIVRPKTLKDRLLKFSLVTCGIVLILFGFLFLYSRQISQKYENTIYSMNLLREYYQNLDAAVLAQKGYLYYEGESDYNEAEAAYDKLEDTILKLSGIGTDKTCYYEIRNIKEMTYSLRSAIEEAYDVMNQYHAGKIANLKNVNEAYAKIYQIHDAINSEYMSVNESMLSYGNEIYKKVRAQKIIVSIFFVFSAVFGSVLLYDQIRRINYSVVVPIQELIYHAQEVKQGNFPEKITVKSETDQEMTVLTEVFESMVTQLKEQIDTLKNYIKVQKELQESRFKELQLQINPHFMFNTLNMLVENAYLEQAETTAYLLKITAKMFRYSLDFSGRLVPLYREMEELGNYVLIQEQRYGERIQFDFELDERFHHIQIPALILQPLVENAVVHGVADRLVGALIKIETRFYEKQNRAEIIIEDNGCGISESELEKIRKEMDCYSAKHSVKVGLGNVNMRLKMHFGARVRIDIESEEKKGTRIRIKLTELEGEKNVSDIDCR